MDCSKWRPTQHEDTRASKGLKLACIAHMGCGPPDDAAEAPLPPLGSHTYAGDVARDPAPCRTWRPARTAIPVHPLAYPKDRKDGERAASKCSATADAIPRYP